MKRWLYLSSLLLVTTGVFADLTALRQQQLHNMLVQDCGSCHGLRFRGGLGPALLPEQLRHKPRQLLLSSILQGRPGTAMPGWSGLLSKQEANWMLDQLISGIKHGDGL